MSNAALAAPGSERLRILRLRCLAVMKAKFFNYVVHSRGRSVKGSFTSKPIIDVRRMTQLAAWSAQEAAYEEELGSLT